MSVKFETFLEDPSQYEAAERYWEGLFKKLFQGRGDGNEWVQWFAPEFVDGTAFHDGNPIFNRICESKCKVIRVIQLDPKEYDSGKIAAWMDRRGLDDRLLGLVFACVLTDEAEKVAERLLRAFVVEDLDMTDMRKLITSLGIETDRKV